MICVDSSALIAVLLGEPAASDCARILAEEPELLISAATLAEAMIVAGSRGMAEELAQLVGVAELRVDDVTRDAALRVAEAYRRWGKGHHAARLNYGDCFSYELASRLQCPLLFVGDDFAKTDVRRAL